MDIKRLIDAGRAIEDAKSLDALLKAFEAACDALSKDIANSPDSDMATLDDATARIRPLVPRVDLEALKDFAASESKQLERFVGTTAIAERIAKSMEQHLREHDEGKPSPITVAGISEAIVALRDQVCLIAAYTPVFREEDLGILGKIAARVTDGLLMVAGIGGDVALVAVAVSAHGGPAVLGAFGIGYASVKAGVAGVAKDVKEIDTLVAELDLDGRVSKENLKRIRDKFFRKSGGR